MTMKELFSEWRNPQELLKGAIIAGLYLVVVIICILLGVEFNHKEIVLYSSLLIAILNVVAVVLTYRIIKNNK